MKVGVALNSGTPICVLVEILPEVNKELIMTINPGVVGQKMLLNSMAKIFKLKNWMANEPQLKNLKIIVVYGVKKENILIIQMLGAGYAVMGTQLFQNNCITPILN